MSINRILKTYAYTLLISITCFAQTQQASEELFKKKLAIAQEQGTNQNFVDAFDYGWEALEIAESLNDTLFISQATSELGRLLNYFNKNDQAEALLIRSKNLNKILLEQKRIEVYALISSYYDLSILYRSNRADDISLKYLDSCYQLINRYELPDTNRGYIDAEYANIQLRNNRFDGIEKLLKKTLNNFNSIPDEDRLNKSFIVFLHTYLGDYYLLTNNERLAIKQYKLALESIDKYETHRGSRISIYKSLSKAQFRLGNYEDAYRSLSISSNLNEGHFSVRSHNNSNLIELKNKYKEIISDQKLELVKKEHDLLVSRIIIIAFIAIVLVASFILLQRQQKLKLSQRNEEIISEKALTDQQLDVKNKELTANTLKLIEKEELINKLTDQLKGIDANNKETKALISLAKSSSKVMWDEFNTRFIDVNKDFYKRLKEKFPDLSPTELKHCALIKLNFSSKEMSQLLGISLTGVNVARYRLRKKFDLTRDVNLTKFISEI